jgi:hypothetical protein
MDTDKPQITQGGIRDIHSKVKEWLSQEGYPTEFTAANAFRRHKFRVHQGHYIRDNTTDAVREIDILAAKTCASRNYLVRAYHVVECKWSQDKPWIVFTSHDAHISHAACVAQTIGSLLGSTILWALAGDETLHTLDLFSTPSRPGFNGRQAFSKGNDHFYSAMKSVTTLASLLMDNYEHVKRPSGKIPQNAVVAFPVIIVDGQLFEAFFDAATNDMRLESVDRIRCHWRGAPSWKFRATIDIVTLNHLEEFAEKRAHEIELLLRKIEQTRHEIAKCFEDRSLDSLQVKRAARGIVGLPPLLREVVTHQKKLSGGNDSTAS